MNLRRLPVWALTFLATLPPIAIAFALAPWLREGGAATAIVMGLTLIWLVGFTMYAWRRLDEAGREAHKFAWFWGGTFGLVALELVAFAALYIPALADPITGYIKSVADGDNVAASAFFVGVFSAAVVQVLCYGAVWTGWWLYRRSGR